MPLRQTDALLEACTGFKQMLRTVGNGVEQCLEEMNEDKVIDRITFSVLMMHLGILHVSVEALQRTAVAAISEQLHFEEELPDANDTRN